MIVLAATYLALGGLVFALTVDAFKENTGVGRDWKRTAAFLAYCLVMWPRIFFGRGRRGA